MVTVPSVAVRVHSHIPCAIIPFQSSLKTLWTGNLNNDARATRRLSGSHLGRQRHPPPEDTHQLHGSPRNLRPR